MCFGVCFGVLETQFDYTLACKHVVVEDTKRDGLNSTSIFAFERVRVAAKEKKAVKKVHGLAVP